jgi:hypothetical protein
MWLSESGGQGSKLLDGYSKPEVSVNHHPGSLCCRSDDLPSGEVSSGGAAQTHPRKL